ncbi:MAG: AI-2E family transporter, partial [Nanoarchaeota archaeon]
VPSEVIREQIINALSTITNVIFQKLYNSLITLTFSIPNLIIYLILISLGQFYFLIDGKKILKFLINHLPFDKYNKIIIDSLKKTIDSIIYGLIIPPLVQSIALVLILFLLGIKLNYILVGFIGFLFALIPSLGIWVVWLPLSIKVWSESTGKLIIYFFYNLLVTSNIDFLTRIFVAYKIANVPMWLVIFTSLGGLLSNGFIGMIVALFIGTFLYILYYDLKILEKKEKNNSF